MQKNPFKQIDLSYLNSIADNDQEIVKELIEIFIDQLPEFTIGLGEAFKKHDWATIASLAHKAKSSVVSMGMTDLGNAELKNLELLAKHRRIKELTDKKLPEDNKELTNLQSSIKSYSAEKQNWVHQNANDETMKEIIDKFVMTCELALEELNNAFGT